jgi:hypothetical protein
MMLLALWKALARGEGRSPPLLRALRQKAQRQTSDAEILGEGKFQM